MESRRETESPADGSFPYDIAEFARDPVVRGYLEFKDDFRDMTEERYIELVRKLREAEKSSKAMRFYQFSIISWVLYWRNYLETNRQRLTEVQAQLIEGKIVGLKDALEIADSLEFVVHQIRTEQQRKKKKEDRREKIKEYFSS